MKLLAVCREVDKESGRVSVYPLDLEITSEILTGLKMRAQFNPELRYFTTTTARWDRYGEVMAGILKRRTVSRADLDNIGSSRFRPTGQRHLSLTELICMQQQKNATPCCRALMH